MSIYVICNPTAARGAAGRKLQRVQRLLARQAEFRSTEGRGHAEELAFAAALAGHGTVVAAGGDGTVHEVANGILRAGRADVAFGVVPLGSGNDYASALQVATDARSLCAGLLSPHTRAVDVGRVRDERGRERFFVNTLGIGLSGAVSWESMGIKRLRGLALYSVAVLRAIWKHFHAVNAVLNMDDQRHEWPILYMALALGQREGGGFVVAPHAKLDDGLFDYLHAGRVTRLQALRYAPRLLRGDVPPGDPLLRTGQCRSLIIQADQPLIAHADGEMLARPGDDTRLLEIELLPHRLAVRNPCRAGS
jgi:YegS/Rv2252/BmrU family lipid kinase